MDVMRETRKFMEEMNGEGDIIRNLRTEIKNLKRKFANETKAKDEEINNLKVELANETKEKNEEINKRKMAVSKCKQFKNEINRENKVVTATMVVMDEMIIHLEKELKNSQEEVNIVRMEEKLKLSWEEAKNINLEEQLKTCEENSDHNLQSFYRVMRRLVEVDVKLQAQAEEIKKLNEDVETLQKFKQNYKARDINNKWIMEQLDELEHVTTNFSFLRRRTSKRELIKRLKDLIGLTMKMRYVEEDNADDEELQLR